ncbi:MAG: hypothetical protein HC857_06045 [Synechococcales cyanobacterium RU_4_20]|nr:hypothetical protein [Synechococcales cyanobacterium RU_4_20]NJR67373.1 hypothetical protein [Synechococcales cyanobacterium CRU_2_2]
MKPSAFCQDQFQQKAYRHWQGILPWLSTEVSPSSPLSSSPMDQIAQLLSAAQGNPKQIQLAIDDWGQPLYTLSRAEQRQPKRVSPSSSFRCLNNLAKLPLRICAKLTSPCGSWNP